LRLCAGASNFLCERCGLCSFIFYHKGTKDNKSEDGHFILRWFSLQLCAFAEALNRRDFAPWRAIFFVNVAAFAVLFFTIKEQKNELVDQIPPKVSSLRQFLTVKSILKIKPFL
jgi:hypothetical protein